MFCSSLQNNPSHVMSLTKWKSLTSNPTVFWSMFCSSLLARAIDRLTFVMNKRNTQHHIRNPHQGRDSGTSDDTDASMVDRERIDVL